MTMYMAQANATSAIIISRIPKFLFLSFFNNGYERKVIKKAKLRWIALAGTSIKTPKPTIKGNGEAYQSWNKDQQKAIKAIVLRCKPERDLVLLSTSSYFLAMLFSDI